MRQTLILTAALALCACTGDVDETGSIDDPAMGTRPAGVPELVTVEGRVEGGTECDIVRTPEGEIWAVSFGEADFGPGDYISITGEVADASFCMEGQGTLIPQSITEIDPPARDRDPDRDPARAGGIALDEDYLTGSWVAKGADADCTSPDFRISTSYGGIILSGEMVGHDNDAMVALGDYPRLDLDEPRQDLPIEARGPDGLAILRPATDARYDPFTIGSATITGDGVVFVKCA